MVDEADGEVVSEVMVRLLRGNPYLLCSNGM